MRKLDQEFKNRKINYNSLLEYGFINRNNFYTYQEEILGGEFKVVIEIENDIVRSKLIETFYNEEYLNVDNEDMIGEYVGNIREEYKKVINKIVDNCTESDIFKNEQTKAVIKYIKDKYNDDLEFLWEKFVDNGIWRNKKNKKWYAALLTVKATYFDIDSNDIVEVIDLRYEKGKTSDIIDNKKVFPGYHMNKSSWITIKLDGTMDNLELFKLIDNSYNIINDK